MKLLVASFAVSLGLASSLPLQAGELTPATVAERLAREEGYQFFTFRADTDQPYQLVARFNGIEKAQHTLDLPACKECVIAVRLGKDNTLEAVRAYSERVAVSMVFPAGHFPAFNQTLSQSEVQLGEPFLSLDGTGGEVQLLLRPRKV